MPSTAATKAKPKAPPSLPHHIQFGLVAANFAPVTQARQYRISWTNVGEKVLQTVAGRTDAQGLTQLITTVGKVPVTLEIAAPEEDDCKIVGSANARPLANKPLVRVQLQMAAKATSAPKPANACEQVVVREGKQQIRFEIHNVKRYTSRTSGTSYPNYLKELPYLIVDAKKKEVIGTTIVPDENARKMKGDNGLVATETVNVDGVESVGLVLGSATDSPELWKANDGELILYRTVPRESGLTTVVIREAPELGDLSESVSNSTDYAGKLNGSVWNLICRSYTTADVQRILPGSLEIVVPWPTPMHIDFALGRQLIDETKATAYRRAHAARQALIKAGGKLPDKPTLRPLAYACSWADLLGPIYDGRIENAEPPNPDVPVIVTCPVSSDQ